MSNRYAAVLLFATVSFSALAASASAVEIQCAKHDALVGLLEKKYKEQARAGGTISDERYMQIFVSDQGSWTILVIQTDGQACILAGGKDWEKIPVLPQSTKAEKSS